MRALALLVSLTLAFPVTAQVFESSAGPIRVTQVAEGLDHPWGLAFLPDGRFLVTERDGRLKLVAADGTATEVAGVPEVAARGQGGLLDVALAHDFAESGRIYLSYSRPEPSGRARTAVAAATLDLAGPALSGVTDIFRMEPATRGGRHFGSRIVVTPEGNLFVTLGDRGERDMAQDTNTHQGTLIHILPDGTPAPGNPFLSGGGLPEIFSWGHRNAQGAALDPATGTLWTVEHGARGGDEINRPEVGVNYGWPVISYGRHYSGFSIGVGTEQEGLAQPVFFWDPSIAPSGLAVYRGAMFPEWDGDLLVGALKFELISRLDMTGDVVTGEERLLEGEFGRVRDVRVGPDGAVWFITDEGRGGLYRITRAE